MRGLTNESVLRADRCKAFHQLLASGCFVIPNPWVATCRLHALAVKPAGMTH